ncbi:MAG: hypothetical protein HY513_01330 [Candidatus Aenigmarchaeota archaeon]|nr:hypothetical protein [Candidatus Aenigmarchaeota archaeon]
METKLANGVLLLLAKDFSAAHTVTSIAKELKLSRVGVWKILKNFESENLVKLNAIGKGKTSVSTVRVNFYNIVTEKTLSLRLTEEAMKQKRWRINFSDLENMVDFLILYGSIVRSPKEANDIDIIGVVSKKSNFTKLHNIIAKIQKTQSKKIHAINFTEAEFMAELKKPNEAFVNAVKTGVVLFGQEKFVNFIKRCNA